MAERYINDFDVFKEPFFKGDTITFYFSFTYDDGSPIDLNRGEVRFYMFPYGQSDLKVKFNNLDYKIGVISQEEKNKCSIVLHSTETENLEFYKYTFVPRLILKDGSNRQFIRGEGHLTFKAS